MYERYVRPIVALYGIHDPRIMHSESGYRNTIYPIVFEDNKLQLTFFKNEPGIVDRINLADDVSSYLAGKGLPTRTRYDKRIIKMSSVGRNIYAGLYNYLPGETIPWEAYTRKHIKLLGKTMSDMHYLLKDYPGYSQPSVTTEYLDTLERMDRYFSQSTVVEALHNKLAISINLDYISYKKLLEGCSSLPHQQQIHMDFVRGNVLFAGDEEPEITGILDFEKTTIGHPIVDAARTLAFLLVDCKYKNTQETWRLFIHSGYQKQGLYSLPTTGKLLDKLVELFLVYDFYKFLLHNPYEYLSQNEHFVRTKELLSRRNVIKLD